MFQIYALTDDVVAVAVLIHSLSNNYLIYNLSTDVDETTNVIKHLLPTLGA